MVIVVDAHTHQRTGAVDFDDGTVRPMGQVIAPDGHTLYVTGGRGKTVHAISLDGEPKVARKIADVGARPWGIGITRSGDRLYTANGVIPGAVLVDGFVAGMWRLARTREAATVTIEMFGPERERDALTAEAERVLAFAAPGADGSVRFAPLVTSP